MKFQSLERSMWKSRRRRSSRIVTNIRFREFQKLFSLNHFLNDRSSSSLVFWFRAMCVEFKSITVEINLNLLNKYKGGSLNFIVTQPLQSFPMKKCYNYLKHFLLRQKSKKEKTIWVIINWKYSIFFFSLYERGVSKPYEYI
jgi:hypothetical protein